ncbi:DEAD/DEAH box helicase [Hydrogenimonas sp. SS33]|uniref:DEAD/DEAH box helicase n=1 Tax=Hydrogenimonas leucolamina TaxID=2954236 RepID=UPI00336C0143
MSQENHETAMEAEGHSTMRFSDFGFKRPIMRAIERMGFQVPSPIQEQVIPLILQGHDVVGQAHTGTGKTAAFGLPALNNIEWRSGVQLLVITPTRELATQVSDELFSLGRFAGIRTVSVYGGQSYRRQLDLIGRGAQVVVATPGRLLDMLSSGKLEDFNPAIVVLDEADEMLDMGFLDDIKEIFSYLPQQRQTLLFSATMPEPIKELAKHILYEPKFVSVTKKETTNKDIRQLYYVIEEKDRDEAIVRLLEKEEPEKAIVFCRMKREVDRVAEMLQARGFNARGLHGDMEMRERMEVIKGFRGRDIDILVATDVAARGLNIEDVSHVFNYHIPFDPESYVHRIGRTGRAGRKGTAITLVTPLEFKELERIRQKVGAKMEYGFVGAEGESEENLAERIANAVREQEIDQEAVKVYEQLTEEMAPQKVAYKLLSMIMEKGLVPPSSGSIGLSKAEVERLLEESGIHEKPAAKKGGGRRRGGNRRRR